MNPNLIELKRESDPQMQISTFYSEIDKRSRQKISKNRDSLDPNKEEGLFFSEAPLHSPKRQYSEPEDEFRFV